MTRRPSVYARLAGAPVGRVAEALGLAVADHGGRFGPCPACDAGASGRAPVLATADRKRWTCRACEASGDAAELIGRVVLGRPPAGADDWQRVADEAEALGLVVPLDGRAPAGAGGPPGASVSRTRGTGAPAPGAGPGGPPAAPDKRWPTRDELAALGRACGPVADDAEAVAWCRSRGLDPARLDALRLARVLSRTPGDEVEALTWPRLGERRGWWSGWRLVLGAVGLDGSPVAARARWVGLDAPTVGGKVAVSRGVPAGPACYADPVGRWLLAAGPAARPGAEVPGTRWRWSGAVVIAEGEPDWLTLASSPARDRRAATAAVLGVWSGAWSAELGERLRSARVVRLHPHPDAPGERLAAKILETLPASVRGEVVRG